MLKTWYNFYKQNAFLNWISSLDCMTNSFFDHLLGRSKPFCTVKKVMAMTTGDKYNKEQFDETIFSYCS